MTTRRLLVLAVLSSLALAAPASAAVAPGRVVFPLRDEAKVPSVDPLGLSVGVAHPDRRVTLAGTDRARGVVLVQLRADGSLDPSFGTGGIARIPVPFASGLIGPMPLQLMRRPDGRIVLVAAGPAASKYQLQQLVFVRVTPDGKLDASFGDGGIAQPGIQGSCANCSPAALQADGAIVFTGNTGGVPPAVENDPTVKPDFHWVVARLTPSGALDAAFGQQGVATLPGARGVGYGATTLPGGAIGVIGSADDAPKLARITAAGTLDPAFNGGAPVTPPGSFNFAFGVLGRATGALEVLGTRSGTGQLLRYTPTGELDPTFGDRGAVSIKAGVAINELLPAPDGGAIVAGPTTHNPQEEPVALRVTRIGPTGAIAASGDVPVPFGGGLATVFARYRAPRVTPLNQTGFHPDRAFARPDGGLVLPGAVGVVQYTGEGAGYETEQAAVAAITPALALDATFGGTTQPAKISVRVAEQRASMTTNRRLLRVLLVAKTSGPGLARLTVKAGKRTVARSTAAVFFTGTQRLPALLTLTGRRTLKHARRVRVTITATFRDLAGSTATATAKGTLR